ncbi:MAG: hypothetical protein QM586_17860 [Xenophilus sp.]
MISNPGVVRDLRALRQALSALGIQHRAVAVLVIANRQRAIGNSVHEAGHMNLHRGPAINDAMASVPFAPVAFNDIRHCRGCI